MHCIESIKILGSLARLELLSVIVQSVQVHFFGSLRMRFENLFLSFLGCSVKSFEHIGCPLKTFEDFEDLW